MKLVANDQSAETERFAPAKARNAALSRIEEITAVGSCRAFSSSSWPA